MGRNSAKLPLGSMARIYLFLCVVLGTLLAQHVRASFIVVTNRNEGTLSVIEPESAEVTNYPAGVMPGYVNNIGRYLYVSDSGAEEILRYKIMDDMTLMSMAPIPIPGCEGGFHMVSTQDFTSKRYIYVTCRGTAMTYVVDPKTEAIIHKIPVPEFREGVDGSEALPHDVTANAQFFYITYDRLVSTNPDEPAPGITVQYNVQTGAMMRSVESVSDPHVAIRGSSELLIASQSGFAAMGTVLYVDAVTMEVKNSFQRVWTPGSHGAFISSDLTMAYTGNLPNPEKAIVAYSLADGELVKRCRATSTVNEIPHNIATSGNYLFVTHSGATSTAVTRFRLSRGNACPIQGSAKVLTTGLNPFGIFEIDVML